MTIDVPERLSSTNRRSSRCAIARIDVAGRLVGEQQFRLRDDGARDRGALLLAARQRRRQRGQPIAETDPAQQFDDLVAIARLGAAEHAQRQRDVLIGRQMIEQAEILEHQTDAPAQHREIVLAELARVVAEQFDLPGSASAT